MDDFRRACVSMARSARVRVEEKAPDDSVTRRVFAALRVNVGVGGGGVDAADAGAPVERSIAREAARGNALLSTMRASSVLPSAKRPVVWMLNSTPGTALGK